MIASKNKCLCELIKQDCVELINKKKVDLEDLAFDLGISEFELIEVFTKKCEDFQMFLKAYDILLER